MSTSESERSIMWFRRDLRIGDHPALHAAIAAGPGGTLGVFVLDPKMFAASGPARQAFLIDSLTSLAAHFEKLGGHFVIKNGRALKIIPALVMQYRATSVHISADATPLSAVRDVAVERALGDTPLVRTGSPYAVTPGRVRKSDDSPYKVYTPFYRAWSEHGWHSPATDIRKLPAGGPAIASDSLPDRPDIDNLPEGGEAAARRRWKDFLAEDVDGYDKDRNRPDLDTTSRLSAYLHFGCIHPRTLLADLADKPGAGVQTYRKEIAWREFYGDVLFHNPESAHDYLDKRFKSMSYAGGKTAETHLQAWKDGKTGYPMVDAGMRQLLHEGWMHNRVRMIVASFLVKDLHLEWTDGAAHFMHHLVDGDIASNQHGWQWVAGCGTDAAPYFRVFNPILQGVKFDPQGDYVRRYVEELRGVPGKAVHQPWDLADGLPEDYPDRIVDHFVERDAALARYDKIKGT